MVTRTQLSQTRNERHFGLFQNKYVFGLLIIVLIVL